MTFSTTNERRALQCVVAIGALIPIFVGAAGAFLGRDLLGPQELSVSLDSHFRYLSGILLAIGLSFVSFIPHIEMRTREVRLLTFLVFIGGLARFYGVFVMGWPSHGMSGGLVMELVITPLLCLWQGRVARRYAK